MSRLNKAAPTAASVSNANSKCQKCLQNGHWTADCPNLPLYKTRPSRTALLKNPPVTKGYDETEETLETRINREREEIIKQVLSADDAKASISNLEDEGKLNPQKDAEPESNEILSSDTDFTTDEELLSNHNK